jgi:hypothetical protein
VRDGSFEMISKYEDISVLVNRYKCTCIALEALRKQVPTIQFLSLPFYCLHNWLMNSVFSIADTGHVLDK